MLLITISFICLALAVVVFASKKKTSTNNVQTVGNNSAMDAVGLNMMLDVVNKMNK